MPAFTPYTPTTAASAPPSGATPGVPATPTMPAVAATPTAPSSSFIPYTPGQTTPVSQLPTVPTATPVAPPAPSTIPGTGGVPAPQPGSNLVSNIKQLPSQLYGAITSLFPGAQVGKAIGNTVGGTIQSAETGSLQPLEQAGAQNNQDFSKIVGDTVQAVTLPLSLVMGGAGGSTGNATIDSILSKGTGSWWGKILNAGMKYAAAGGALSGGATAAGGGTAGQTTESTALGALGGFLGGGAGQTVDGAITGLRTLRNPETAAIAKSWALPSTVNMSSFNKARDILANDPTIPDFLGELRANPAGHIANERYDTGDTADALRQTAGQMSRDVLRPSFQMADYYTPKTPVSDIIAQAVRNIKNVEPGTLAGDEEILTPALQKEGEALSRRYPEGMSLTNMHDEGINYNQKGGYKPNGTDLDNNTATRNRILGQTLKQTVSATAPEDIPANNFNEYLQKYYHAADYLDALNTKVAPRSYLLKAANRGAAVIGAIIGHGIGGGVLGGVGGYMIGGALEHAAENLSGSAAGSFFSNLEKTNPAAFQQVLDYLTKANAGEIGLLALPAPKGEQAIPLGPRTPPESSVTSVAAQKGPIGVDTKTGRFKTTYTSTPK